MKTKIIPFNTEMAKKIQAREIKGRICTKEGDFTARIICFDKDKLVHGDGTTERQIVSLTYNANAREEVLYIHNQKGEVQSPFAFDRGYDLVLEVPDTEPEKSQFKPFDKVLVRYSDKGEWKPRLYSRKGTIGYCTQDGFEYMQILPYEGNEHLTGTPDKPKED